MMSVITTAATHPILATSEAAISMSLLCSVVWQVIVACRSAFPVGQLLGSSLLISSLSLEFILASHQFSAFSSTYLPPYKQIC